jgi:hypothetical protein
LYYGEIAVALVTWSEALHRNGNTHHSAGSAISLCGNAPLINNDLMS